MLDDIRILQAIRLKGRVGPRDLIDPLGVDISQVENLLRPLTRDGLVEEVAGRVRLTTSGRIRRASLLTAEREAIDQAVLTEARHEFDAYNATFKQLVSDWQLIDGERPNDHTDDEYDHRITQRLRGLHDPFLELVVRLGVIAALLSEYPRRFTAAFDKFAAGERPWLSAPMIDSYHTVWFELHENLLELAGLSRAGEAAAGRAE